MLTNYSGLETSLESRCSTSHFFLYTSRSFANLVTSEDDANFEGGIGNWVSTALGANVVRSSSYSKYGQYSGKVGCTAAGGWSALPLDNSLAGNTVYITMPNLRPGVDDWTVKLVYGADPVTLGEGTSVASHNFTTQNTEWSTLELSGSIPPASTGIYIIVKCNNLGSFPRSIYLDGIRVSTTGHSNWSGRFIDTTEDELSLCDDISEYLTGSISWGEQPDPTITGKFRAYTNRLEFTIRDQTGLVDNWKKRQTGVHLRVGANSSSTYAQQTPCFHGIIWDWTLVNGENNTYSVVAHDLSKLWKDYKVGAESLDGPRAFGIVVDTMTTHPIKKFYSVPSSAANGFAYKVTLGGQEVNRNNMCVAKFFAGESGEQNLLGLMLPLQSNTTAIGEYFQGVSHSDVIEHFHSGLGIASGMPATYASVAGDTLTATIGPWAHFGQNESAWKQLGDSLGVKLYSFYYDENGQIRLVKPDEARAASAVTRGTSETDSTKAGQIREFEWLDEDNIINDPAISITKYGVDSSTGSSIPNITDGSYQGKNSLIIPGSRTSEIRAIAPHSPFIPMIDNGNHYIDEFDNTLTISTYPASINDYFRANRAGSGGVAVGSGSVLFSAPTTDDAAFVELSATPECSSYRITTRVNVATASTFEVRVATGQGSNQNWKLRALFESDGEIRLQSNDSSNIWELRRTTFTSDGVQYYSQAWAVASAGTIAGQWTATEDYYVTIEKFGPFYGIYVCDQFFLPQESSAGVLACAGIIPDDPAYMVAGDDYIQIGNVDTSTSCSARCRNMIYHSPHEHGAIWLKAIPFVSSIFGNETFEQTIYVMYGQGQNPSFVGDTRVALNVDGSYDRTEGVISHGSSPDARYCALNVTGAPFQPEVHSVFTASATQVGMDGSTTVSDSQLSNGYKGLNEGSWEQRWLWSDSAAQDLANTIAKFNLEDREPISFKTKFNPKYKPHDIITVTYFDKIVSQEYELVGIGHKANFDLAGGGAETKLKARKWTA